MPDANAIKRRLAAMAKKHNAEMSRLITSNTKPGYKPPVSKPLAPSRKGGLFNPKAIVDEKQVIDRGPTMDDMRQKMLTHRLRRGGF